MNKIDISNRSPLLDCIRAFAVTAVVFYHSGISFDIQSLDAVAKIFRTYGLLGVDLFFPLSGYLICRFLIYQNKSGSIKTFFLRRLFRIVPLYMVAVSCYFIAAIIFNHEAHLQDRIWIPYSMLTAWYIFFEGRDTVPYTITWSISVEEFSYIVLGLCAAITRKHLTSFIMILAIAPIFLRLYFINENYSDVQFFPLTRIDSIALGGLTAYYLNEKKSVITYLISLLILCVLVGKLNILLEKSLFFTIVPLLSCLFIAIFEKYGQSVNTRFLKLPASVGFHSYFIYLFHYMFIYAVIKFADKVCDCTISFWLLGWSSLLITYVASVFSYRFYEGPLMRFGRSLESNRS